MALDECEHFESCDLPALRTPQIPTTNFLDYQGQGAEMGVLSLYLLFPRSCLRTDQK